MWTHTVLEIYQPLDEEGEILPWPADGEPADWIHEDLVGYCQGQEQALVLFIPLWKIVWWKLQRLVKIRNCLWKNILWNVRNSTKE